jgi:hypothetical protein
MYVKSGKAQTKGVKPSNHGPELRGNALEAGMTARTEDQRNRATVPLTFARSLPQYASMSDVAPPAAQKSRLLTIRTVAMKMNLSAGFMLGHSRTAPQRIQNGLEGFVSRTCLMITPRSAVGYHSGHTEKTHDRQVANNVA